jgi:hypothetical protein
MYKIVNFEFNILYQTQQTALWNSKKGYSMMIARHSMKMLARV